MNNTSKLSEILNGISPVSQQTVEMIVENGSYQSYKKSEIIFPEKRYNAFEYFQIEGVSHRFNKDETGQMITTGIYPGGIVITPNFARTLNSHSIFSLQALTDCLFLNIPIGTFDELRKNNPQIWSFGQRVIEREFIRHLNYEVLFRSYSAKDRLLFFRSNYRQLENIIPHTIIASYLGITPVSFSRLRNEMAKDTE